MITLTKIVQSVYHGTFAYKHKSSESDPGTVYNEDQKTEMVSAGEAEVIEFSGSYLEIQKPKVQAIEAAKSEIERLEKNIFRSVIGLLKEENVDDREHFESGMLLIEQQREIINAI